MKHLAFFLLLLAAPGMAQTLRNQPAGFTLYTYPGNPLTIRLNLTGAPAAPDVSAVLKFGVGLRAMPDSLQPNVSYLPGAVLLRWAHYPRREGNQYLEIYTGGSVGVTGTVVNSYAGTISPNPASLTINYTNTAAINLAITYPDTAPAPVTDLSIWNQLLSLLFN